MKGNFMSNKIFGDKFWYGASCAPYAKSTDWPLEQWDDDLSNMKKMGFNIARIFVPWDRIERREGEFDFSKQDHFMELAEKYEIGVLLNIGGVFDNLQGIYPPWWLPGKYQVSKPCNAPADEHLSHGLRVQICLDDPIYREKAFSFIAKAVSRYASHPATAGWMIWNEPWVKNCYCQATKSRFRSWLKEKYNNNLDALNRLWGSEFPIDYADWNIVEPPTGLGFLGGSLNAWRDWHDFNEFRMTDAMHTVNNIVKENDQFRHPTTANICTPHAICGNQSNLKISELYKSMDVMGFSYYTVAHGEAAWMTPFLKSLCVHSFRWFSPEPERRTLVLETEVGPNYFMITEAQRTLNNWLAVGANAKSIICWNYRSRYSDNQVGNFNMAAWDGSETPRTRYNSDMAKMFNKHAELINNSFPERQAAVLMPDSLTLTAMSTHQHIDVNSNSYNSESFEKLKKSMFGAFKVLWDMNITADGLKECNMNEIGKYKVVLLPMLENMSPEIAALLRVYVKNGGTLIAESPFAFKDENNFLHGSAPIYGLDEVFGAFTRDREGWESASDIIYTDGGGKGKVFFLWHPYELTTSNAMASYEDGRASVVVNNFGKGKAILAGTEIFRQYFSETPDIAASGFIRKAILASGAERTAEILIDGEIADASSIEVCRLDGKKGIIYIVLNHNETPVSFRLKIREKTGSWYSMNDERKVDLNKKIELPAQGVLAIAQTR